MSEFRRRMMMVGKALPYDAEVEYLENVGESSIDTMYHIASYNVSLEIRYMQTANTTAIGFLFYQFNGVGNNYVAIYSNASNKLSAVWGNKWKASTTSSDRNIHTLKLENKTLYRDGTSLVTTDNPAAFMSSDNNVHIFSTSRPILARVYWAKIHYNNELVRDLIPVRVGQVGYMYDKVYGQLLGNAGTESFILGPDV